MRPVAGRLWLVCLSGGADSVVALDVCRRLAATLGAEVASVHVQHHLRESAEVDAAVGVLPGTVHAPWPVAVAASVRGGWAGHNGAGPDARFAVIKFEV